MPSVLIFAPKPTLTVTVEDHAGNADVHIHVGGQGVWQARMISAFGAHVALVAGFGGEPGTVARRLLDDAGLAVAAVDCAGANPVVIADRREGERDLLLEAQGTPLGRHEVDELTSTMLREAKAADLVVLSGPVGEHTIDPDVYRRLASDLRQLDTRVLVDLAGDRLAAALAGGVAVAKVSHSELADDGRVDDPDDPAAIVAAMRVLRDEGADVVIVTRAEHGALVLDGDRVLHAIAPAFEAVDTAGAGDSFVGALTASLAAGEELDEALRMAAAAGALNVTRHGLGTGDANAIRDIAEHVRVEPWDER